MIPLSPHDALLIADVQNDFLPGGALGIRDGDKIIPVLANYVGRFQAQGLPIFLTRDWHPPNHCSFTAQGGPWPSHGVAGSPGALPPSSFATPLSAVVIHEAVDHNQEAYSAFQHTGLDRQLRALNVQRLFIGGLATDYCVVNSVRDARTLGYDVCLLIDGIKAVNLQPGDDRRTHGAEAGLLAACASYLAGFAGTATILAGVAYGIPLYDTMAHSFVQAHEGELFAFEHFSETRSNNVMLLLDTYDTEAAADKVVAVAESLRAKSIMIKGVRLDSGDLADHARNARRILDEGAWPQVYILASGNLDEYRLRDLVQSGAPIDSLAVGTAVTTSSGPPSLDCAYKLQEYPGRPCRKRSEGKATWPGRKQVYRYDDDDDDGCINHDVVTTEDDHLSGHPLLHPVMKGGRRLAASPPLADIRRTSAVQLGRLPASIRVLDPSPAYDVRISDTLQGLARAVDRTSTIKGVT